ncbi:hypothetical protein BHE74_00033394 [Ensete ventricosum]|nr:hypothetical protein GW17_00021629 [Ensete ventricosum]RWW59652.1 hypothetical protein BHE74_00033394 [Ensete ventricosum]
MGLITHSTIYVCIDASPCPVIVDLVIIGSVGLSHHHALKSLATASWVPLSPPCSHRLSPCPLCATAVAAPTQATTALARRQPPCQGAATPAADTVAPTSDRAGRGWQPLAGALQATPLRASRCKRLLPLAGWPWPRPAAPL